MIFVEKQEGADLLYTKLLENQYKPILMHGGRDQIDRTETYGQLKKNSNNILISTSLMGRGLDIPKVVLVINYTCPTFKEDYIHRIGRTGRAGKKGKSITFITEEDELYVKEII